MFIDALFDLDRFIDVICLVHIGCTRATREKPEDPPGYDDVFETLLSHKVTMVHVAAYGNGAAGDIQANPRAPAGAAPGNVAESSENRHQ